MIVATRWRHDGEMSSVLLIGAAPVAEVGKNRGARPGYWLKFNRGRGIEREAFKTGAEAARRAEAIFDEQLRALLTPEALEALHRAGL